MSVKVDAFLSKKHHTKKIITGIMLNRMQREVLHTYSTGFHPASRLPSYLENNKLRISGCSRY